ncbi:hypothetical protein B0H19DRAFT_650179 [Mycena capillaripes]|nr:hypothetical protein B0H19DRAFT_650179 [Mycena capillaripes]
MLIKLTPPPSPTPTPTILFALVFPDPPQNLPLPPAWAVQLARLAADDLEAPPALHALDRAAAFPSLLSEVLFDLPRGRVACSFLDGATEEWTLSPPCADMLARVITDVEESGRAEERAREWQRAVEAERVRAQREEEMQTEQEKERARQREREREAELEREYEEKMQMQRKGKGKEQSLNSPPAPQKSGARPKGRLHRSRSLLMALVAFVFFSFFSFLRMLSLSSYISSFLLRVVLLRVVPPYHRLDRSPVGLRHSPLLLHLLPQRLRLRR